MQPIEEAEGELDLHRLEEAGCEEIVAGLLKDMQRRLGPDDIGLDTEIGVDRDGLAAHRAEGAPRAAADLQIPVEKDVGVEAVEKTGVVLAHGTVEHDTGPCDRPPGRFAPMSWAGWQARGMASMPGGRARCDTRMAIPR